MYLVHVPLIVGVYRLLANQSRGVLLPARLLVVVLGSAALGELEFACYSSLKRRVDAGSRGSARHAGSGFSRHVFGAVLVGVKLAP